MRAPVLSTRLRNVPVTVGEFSGPLDLLLQLVEARQLPITTVSLRAVTEQFLAALEPLEEAQPELLADFLVVASRLAALKARALLPRPESPEDVEDPLVRDLHRYQAFREVASWLRERDEAGLRSWSRPPQPRVRAAVPEGCPEQLLQALQRWARRQRPVATVRWRPVVSLTAMIERLRARLVGRCAFRTLLGERPTRSEVVVGVLALLTLVRRRLVELEQREPFGEIWVWPKEREPNGRA